MKTLKLKKTPQQTASVFHRAVLLMASLCLLMLSSLASALEARVDRTTLPLNETLQLELSGSFSAFNLSIDLSPLEKDFRVLDNRRSTNMQYINGSFTAQTTLTVTLEPKRAGILTIPSISIEGESSKAIELKVTKANNSISADPNQASPVDIEVTLDNPDTWVQAQMLLKIKLFQSVELYNLELLGVKELQQMGLTVEKIGENKTYQAKRKNVTYHVTELNYVLFADTPGTFKLPEFIFEGQMPTRASRYGKRLEARSEAITVTVKDVPKDYPSATWIPARDLQISDDLADTVELELGDSLNRNLVVSVYGQEAAVIPNMPEIDSDIISVYTDAPELNDQISPEGVTGVRMDNIALISKKPGQLVLPEIQVPWFNTTTGKTEVATLPARTIKILGANGQLPDTTSSTSAAPQVAIDQTPPPFANQSASDEFNNQSSESMTGSSPIDTKESIPTWFLLIFGLVCGIVVLQTGVIWRLYQRTPNIEEDEHQVIASQNWDEALPEDFVSSFRLIQKALQDHQLSRESLPEAIQSLIDRFRATHYGSSKSDASFTANDREELRQQLKQFFDKHSQPNQGPTLYPQ
ncbi:BatD family protein [Litoribrevibacter euphylliae]|uniref:BatD family protein n=1 Tax=Litoribrevibacter euphylliae TaxID=1834034 RepID=A0ABV7HHM0_9GAMM